MYGSIRSACARWYAVPLAVAAVVAATTVLQNRSSHRRLRHSMHRRVGESAEAVIAGVTQMACSADDIEPCRPLCLNTAGGAAVWVSRRRLRTALGSLDAIFDCYALACLSEDVSDATKADVWNCLCLVVEEALDIYRTADALSVDTPAAATGLAVAELLRGRYHVTHFLSPASSTRRLTIGSVSLHIVADAARKNARSASSVRSLAVFARLLRSSCSGTELFLLSALLLIGAAQLSRLLLTTGPLATPSRVLYEASVRDALLCGDDGARVSLRVVGRRVVESLPGRMLAAATAGALLSHLCAAAQDAASDALLRRLRAAIKTDTLLALARFDHVADVAWHVPHRVFGALGVITNFSLADVYRLCSVFTGYAHRCRVVGEAPLQCAAGWATRQGIHWLQRRWTRACLLRTCADQCTTDTTAALQSPPNKPLRRGDACERQNSAAVPRRAMCHYGLQVLLLAAVETPLRVPAAARETLALHTRWPFCPPSSLRATRRALAALTMSGVAALEGKLAAVQALERDRDNDEHALLWADGAPSAGVGASSPGPSFPTVLGLLRSRGEAWQPPPPCSSASRWRGDVWAPPSTREVLLDKVIASMDGVPLMAALATRSLGQRASATTPQLPPPTTDERGAKRDDASVEMAFQVARALEGGDVFAMPPSRSFTSPSAFEFDAEVARLRYHDHDTYTQSVAAVLFVQESHEPLIDRRTFSPHAGLPVLSSSSGWRVAFDHVSFRYPGSTADVLCDVSFDVAPGGFLGVVGYSGAGKSTLLLLLSRLYAPTSGQIYIDGCPIDRIPPRVLRRRLGVTWQGDGNTRFLEGLSVERNIAYGALHRASSETIAEALVAACVCDVVAARPHGTHDSLQTHAWSGGELERLSVARALMVAPAEAGAYLFDECTSGLDSVTEAQVFSHVLRAPHRTTQIMVSHRLSSVQDASEILVLLQGRVVERGTWSELLAQDPNSLFRTLYSAQSVVKAGLNKEVDVMVPSSELTIKQIQDRIPTKYFERSTLHSMLYLARDICQILVAYYVMYRGVMPALSKLETTVYGAMGPTTASWLLVGAVKLVAWNVFWFAQGLSGTALWVLAHECGHQAFSPYRSVNNAVGLVLHSAILVPYHSWRITHSNHHKHTNHLTKDTVFVPHKENKVIELVEETPLAMLYGMVIMFLFGWPLYLLTNVASQDYGRRTNHFEPSSPLFRKEDAPDIVLSDIGILATLFVVGLCTYQFGIFNVYCWYIVPYLWVNFWLLYITYLQHSDIRIPHYNHENWTFVRGAIAAVDRDYGSLFNSWLHHINDSHVVHHLFSQMPFYNAVTVTRKYIKDILGDTYVEDNRPLVEALCKSWKDCRYVIPSEGVSVFYGFNKKRA